MNKLILVFGFVMSFWVVSTVSTRAATPILWGAYAGYKVSDFTSLQQIVGQKLNYAAVFIHWGNENLFPIDIANMAKKDNQTVVIYWEAMDYNVDQPENDSRFSYDEILAGRYDSYMTSFALDAKNSGVPVILIPFEEMNGNWYPWSITKNGNSGQKHIDAYRHIKSFFNQATNVKFGWAINNDSVPDTAINLPLSYYPGDAYVDYVGVDGFNFDNPWQTFSEVFDKPLTSLSTINKPEMIFSMASAPGIQKAEWIKDASIQMALYPQLNGFIWFNENKERDWRIWSDNNSLNAFQTEMISLPIQPTVTPTTIPTMAPTIVPTTIPTVTPTVTPTAMPTMVPTGVPTAKPTMVPTVILTVVPTATPTVIQIVTPTPKQHSWWWWWNHSNSKRH